MNGYKTGGDWADVTSIGRNEVVFEGRHKAYGAFYIRKRYSNTLYFSFLSALTFVALCAYVPYALRNVSPPLAPPNKDGKIKLTETVITINPPPPHITPPSSRPPKANPNQHLAPVITQHTIDSAPRPIIENPNPITVPGPPANGGTTEIGNPGSGPSGPPLPPQKPDQIFTWVEAMPKFNHGDVESYIASKITYSSQDIQLGIEGTVIASFIIEKDGSVSNVKLLRGINGAPDLNEEALKALSEMPKWTPGMQDGHPVRIQFSIPIQFKLH